MQDGHFIPYLLFGADHCGKHCGKRRYACTGLTHIDVICLHLLMHIYIDIFKFFCHRYVSRMRADGIDMKKDNQPEGIIVVEENQLKALLSNHNFGKKKKTEKGGF